MTILTMQIYECSTGKDSFSVCVCGGVGGGDIWVNFTSLQQNVYKHHILWTIA